MNAKMNADYFDSHGQATAMLLNDGSGLRLLVRGYEFTGTMLDDFEPVDQSKPDF